MKYQDFTSQIKSATQQKFSIFLRTAAEQMQNIAEPNTPKETGQLRRSVTKQVLGLRGKVKWGKNYAVFQEKKQFKNYTTPGTGPHFAEDAAKQVASKTSAILRSVT